MWALVKVKNCPTLVRNNVVPFMVLKRTLNLGLASLQVTTLKHSGNCLPRKTLDLFKKGSQLSLSSGLQP